MTTSEHVATAAYVRTCAICGKALDPDEQRQGWTVHATCLDEQTGFDSDGRSATVERGFVTPRYNGVAVWSTLEPPRTQLRAVYAGERLEVLERLPEGNRADAWLRVRLPEGGEGYTRNEAMRAADAAVMPGAAAVMPRFSAPVEVVGEGRAFPASRWVALGLNIFGWLALIGGQLAGIGAAADYECNDLFGVNDCSGEAGARIVLYAGFAGSALIAALFAFGIAYCISYLDRIERRVRSVAA